jgi:hypothetical protein
MPLLEDEPKLPKTRLLTVGLPSFIIAAALSLFTHQYAHLLVLRHACSGSLFPWNSIVNFETPHTDCPIASFAGLAATFMLALVSFAMYMRFPQNLFWGSMAFINASIRIPETLTVFFQLFFHQKSDLPVDESVALNLIHMHDPVVGIVILCFFAITLLFLTLIIVHDTRMVPSKWLVAGGLFILMIPLETILWHLIVPMVA